ncbi:MAG: dTMP kinase [Clostridia bacterium]|nr:dTMP kinase [Clostridia bacterium]
MKGFITFEGCEGVGKSSQVALLSDYMKSVGIDAVFTREPGGSKIAEKIRQIILDKNNPEMSDECESFLYFAARNQHLHDIVMPALESGRLVFCDRYVDSSFAYQGYGRGLSEEFMRSIAKLAVGDIMPEYTVFLDLNPTEAFRRKGGVDKSDRLELADKSFHERVYRGYHKLIEQEPNRFIVIDAGGTKMQTHDKIVQALAERGVFIKRSGIDKTEG